MRDRQLVNSSSLITHKTSTYHIVSKRPRFSSFNMPRLAGIANFNPEKDIPSLTNRVILVTGGMFYSIMSLYKFGNYY